MGGKSPSPRSRSPRSPSVARDVEEAAGGGLEARLKAGLGAEAVHDAADPAFHRPLRDSEFPGDGLVGEAGGEQREKLLVVSGQRSVRATPPERSGLSPQRLEK